MGGGGTGASGGGGGNPNGGNSPGGTGYGGDRGAQGTAGEKSGGAGGAGMAGYGGGGQAGVAGSGWGGPGGSAGANMGYSSSGGGVSNPSVTSYRDGYGNIKTTSSSLTKVGPNSYSSNPNYNGYGGAPGFPSPGGTGYGSNVGAQGTAGEMSGGAGGAGMAGYGGGGLAGQAGSGWGGPGGSAGRNTNGGTGSGGRVGLGSVSSVAGFGVNTPVPVTTRPSVAFPPAMFAPGYQDFFNMPRPSYPNVSSPYGFGTQPAFADPGFGYQGMPPAGYGVPVRDGSVTQGLNPGNVYGNRAPGGVMNAISGGISTTDRGYYGNVNQGSGVVSRSNSGAPASAAGVRGSGLTGRGGFR